MIRPTFIAAACLSLALACSSDSNDAGSSPTDMNVNANQPGGESADGDGSEADVPSDGDGLAMTVSEPAEADMAGDGDAESQANDDLGLAPGAGDGDMGNGDMADGDMGNGDMGDMADGNAGDAPADGDMGDGDMGDAEDEATDGPTMSFFVTSRGSGSGGNFGGIDGADAFCTTLAGESPLDVGGKTWRAYLSTSIENARDRIGDGPWRNFAGVIVANDVEQLHDQGQNGSLDGTWATGDASIALDEQGNPIPNQPVIHDIITGSNLDGTVSTAGTCGDWTSENGGTQNGHSNRGGGGQNPQSWNSAHATGCGEPDPGQNFQAGTVSQGGGRGSIYCFAID